MFHSEEHPYEKAADFLEALRPRHWSYEYDNWMINWRFRGHGDAGWSLIPSTWRNNSIILQTIECYKNSVDVLLDIWLLGKTYGIPENRLQNTKKLVHIAHAEHQLILDFRELLNRLGFPVDTYANTGMN